MLDLVIAGGTLVDGTGAPAQGLDLGVQGDCIAVLGDLSATPAHRRVDARGLIVAPGFIDIHTHHNDEMDGGIEHIPAADNYLRQGVTTCVAGNCGGAAFPIGPHLDRVDRLEIRSNYAVLVGCNTARHAVLTEERPATGAELERMVALVREGFEEGALGLSSGVAYSPFLTTTELIAMAGVAAGYGSFYASHIRSEGDGLLEAIIELIDVVRHSGAGGEISHIKCYGRDHWGKAEQALALVEAARAEGLDVTADQYPYTGCFTGLAGTLFGQETTLRAYRQGGMDRLLAAPLRAEAEARFAARYELLDQGEGIILAPLEPHPEFQGKTLAEYLREQGGDPFAATVGLCGQGHISAIYLAMCEDDVVTYMRSPHVMVGSDGHLRVFGKSFSHPRNFGTFPRVLARYVRDQGVLTVEQAVHKMTAMPARRSGLRRRGRLAPGYIADITVFDPRTVQDHATFRDGNAYATGIELVLLAGQTALAHDQPSPAGHGRVLRRGEG